MNQSTFQRIKETLMKKVEIWMFSKTQEWILIDAAELGILCKQRE